ncbi:MAG: DinB family protein [Vicinamibacterales bacterium]
MAPPDRLDGFVPDPDTPAPRAAHPEWQHALDTYLSEAHKTATVWSHFADADLGFRPHHRSSTVEAILRHQLLSERRFFGVFLGTPEPPPQDVVPTEMTVNACALRLTALAWVRLTYLADRPAAWWLEPRPFFDVERQRIWIFWRRVLHTAHHRTQLTVYLRLLDRPVPSVYGPTADVNWVDADPTNSVAAAERRGSGQ